ncbi:MAG: hypothetical protein AN485_22470 [Anabaena sp. MDT14b]|nr:MAG: hypothetical protein AN485_22470 [Anabaena sp. MDT14b]
MISSRRGISASSSRYPETPADARSADAARPLVVELGNPGIALEAIAVRHELGALDLRAESEEQFALAVAVGVEGAEKPSPRRNATRRDVGNRQ